MNSGASIIYAFDLLTLYSGTSRVDSRSSAPPSESVRSLTTSNQIGLNSTNSHCM